MTKNHRVAHFLHRGASPWAVAVMYGLPVGSLTVLVREMSP